MKPAADIAVRGHGWSGVMHPSDAISLPQARDIIRTWLTKRTFAGVSIRQCDNPMNGTSDDYVVNYEAFVLPQDDRHPYLNIVVTDDGGVGIAFETRARLARRFGLMNFQRGCAVGHEPGPVTAATLQGFLDAVEGGEICLLARRWPLPFLGRVQAVMRTVRPWLGPQLSRHWRWLNAAPEDISVGRSNLLIDFEPL